MTIPASAETLLLGSGGAAGYQVERSLRLNAPDSGYLSRTPASAGNRQTWTWSGWVKRSTSSASQSLLGARGSSANEDDSFSLQFGGYSADADALVVGYGNAAWKITTQLFRDFAAWYHIVVAFDSTQATGSNRVKLYVNGSQITAFSTDTAPTSNLNSAINKAVEHRIGSYASVAAQYFNGYLAEIHFIDGQALTPSSFAETDATTGQWVPKAFSGTYGTNGFHLKFADNSGTTSTTLGKDSSPNGNNWTPNNFSVTAGAGNDSLVDTPTSYGTDAGAGGEVRGNYCTLNPLAKGADVTLANGSLDMTSSSSAGTTTVISTIGVSSGKWYWEVTCNGTSPRNQIGIAKHGVALDNYLGVDTNGWAYSWDALKYNGSSSAYGATFTAGDVIGVALDADAGTLTFYKNNVSQGQAFSGLTSGPYFAAISDGSGGGTANATLNFGQRPFAYAAPSGFKALCDTNLPAPVVAKPNTVMDVALWTGNGSARSITGLGFNPDLVWIKGRSGATDHALYDVVRGVEKRLESNTTDTEVTSDGGVTAFNSDGFSLGTLAQVNTNTATYAGWCWDAGTSTVTNTAGSITSSVRANASAGFSSVTYIGNLNGTGVSTVGHGLGVAPSMVITKRRDGTSDWCVQHISTSSASQILFLSSTSAQFDTSGNGTLSRPTSTVFSVNYSTGLGINGQTHVAYCFAPVAGYSSFGSYTGNGSTDGPFVYTGFRPRWVMTKSTSTTGYWTINDTTRSNYNAAKENLWANDSLAEDTSTLGVDILSNGFKPRTSANYNNSGTTYIYAAFAEAPFPYARAR